jgi:hypothetical protein
MRGGIKAPYLNAEPIEAVGKKSIPFLLHIHPESFKPMFSKLLPDASPVPSSSFIPWPIV